MRWSTAAALQKGDAFMLANEPLRVVLLKPSKYAADGHVERFRRGFMPNSTLAHLRALTPREVNGRPVVVEAIDEYVQTNLRYLGLLRPERCSLLALVGVQSHQMHRALDLAAVARRNGVQACVVGGPHPMTCDTTEAQGHGVSFAMAEAELVWPSILEDATGGALRATYGSEQRWERELPPTVIAPPGRAALRSYVVPMLGVYPARGCPFNCTFCSVVKIAGKRIRSQSVESTLRTLVAARAAGVRLVMFTSDNFNKYPDAPDLLRAMIEEQIRVPFLIQADVQLGRDEGLVELLARAGCAQVFVGAESFSRASLKAIGKHQNNPQKYADLVRICHRHGISTHFSNIIGFAEQDEAAVGEHLRELCALDPFMASFYILTPIPGTDQYDELLDAGLIAETNLDRFDATCSVWRHPRLSAGQLQALLSSCYRKFYAASAVARKLAHRWNASWFVYALGLAYPAFARFAAHRGFHPMAGGLWRVELDRASDYMALRGATYGFKELALPRSLALSSAADRDLYPIGRAQPRVQRAATGPERR
jgi:radical SAM family protein